MHVHWRSLSAKSLDEYAQPTCPLDNMLLVGLKSAVRMWFGYMLLTHLCVYLVLMASTYGSTMHAKTILHKP